jgi:hypothetical protein
MSEHKTPLASDPTFVADFTGYFGVRVRTCVGPEDVHHPRLTTADECTEVIAALHDAPTPDHKAETLLGRWGWVREHTTVCSLPEPQYHEFVRGLAARDPEAWIVRFGIDVLQQWERPAPAAAIADLTGLPEDAVVATLTRLYRAKWLTRIGSVESKWSDRRINVYAALCNERQESP